MTNGIVIIHVADPPKVTLSLGSTLNPDEIKEGDDVYFECHIKANPKENRISWSHDVSAHIIQVLLWHGITTNQMSRDHSGSVKG